MKICTVCNKNKPLSDFGIQRGKPRHLCKECKRLESKEYYKNNKEKKKEWSKQYRHIKKDKDLKATYGIGMDDFNKLREIQEYKCLICGKHENELKTSLCVDHDHDTGKVRGLLCHTCNRALGMFKDNSVILNRAIRYLKGIL